MCGICGIVDYSGKPIEQAAVDAMRDVMVTRGPDDAGSRVLPLVGLGHRRLSIIDLSPRGHQPMPNEDESVWLVFNGEIYNFDALRPELEAAGHAFRSDTDSEVLIHGYEEWGIEGLLQRINGMFGFAIWDSRTEELLVARDRLGKKPLYYGWLHGKFLFGSDLKALWTHDPSAWRVRADSVARFLYWRYLPGRQTIYHDVYQLLPAHYLRLTRDGAREQQYWKLSFQNKFRGGAEETRQRTHDVIGDAVRRRLRSDVPLGAFLSGGVDSSYVVSLMNNGSGHSVRTFSIGTDNPAHDERQEAGIVARHCGTDHTEFNVTPDSWSLLPKLVWAFGQPFGDAAAVPTYYVARCAREHVTVALTGDGGDESFAGYSHHRGAYLASMLKPMVPRMLVDGLLDRAAPLLDAGRINPVSSAARFLRYTHPDPLVRRGSVHAWALHHLERLWPERSRELIEQDSLLEYSESVMRGFDGKHSVDRALYDDLHVLLPFCYNVKVDVATMMSSLEARSPLQDMEVVSWAARLDPMVKMRPFETKALLKSIAARRVPRDVIYRKKHGFSIPMDEWFHGPWARQVEDIVLGPTARRREWFNYDYVSRLWSEHQARRARHGHRLWMLLWLEIWFRMFVDRSMGPDDELRG